ncbi:Leucine-rich repeat - like 10 [Theobroma cacao]|nr:Leucine-rich repeat - like 10 [Theobroma cacao]
MQLNLTGSVFAGQIPLQISHLSKLVSLDLSWNYPQALDERTLAGLVQNLTEVRQLFLDRINMSSINPNVLMDISSSLSSLSLEDCDLQGKFPENIFLLPNLKLLNLGYNQELKIYIPNFNQSNHFELLDLSLTNLSGALPNSIGNLVSLKDLDLSDTSLSGALPNSFGNLVSLKDLDLSCTSLSGALPNSIGNLVSLEYLDLRYTSLSGALPNSIGNLVSLKDLDLSYTSLSGALPNSIGNLVSLKDLDLHQTSLSEALPNSIGNLVSLEHLDLSFTNLSGALPNPIRNLRSLKYLSLSGAPLCPGQIPLQISHLSKLVSLDLSWNHYQTLDERTLGGLVQNLTEVRQLFLDRINMSSINPNVLMDISSSLSSLSLEDCDLQGKFPENIFLLPNLKLLNLGYNQELNIYLPKFNQSNHLELLDLSHANLSGSLPNFIGNLVSLKHLDLSFMNLSGALPNSIGNLVSLEYLDLSFTNLSGALLNSISNLVSLEYLDLSFMNLSGAWHNPISNLRSLKYLSLSGAPICPGSLNLIGNLVSLEELHLRACNISRIMLRSLGNYFSGQIPSSLANLSQLNAFPNLIHLDLSVNFLNGTLPSWLYTTSSLKSINLQHNQLSGHIKQFQHISLERIILGNNKLQGLDPSSMSQLVNLTLLDLSSNNLSGIEESDLFSKVQNLQYLDLSNNNLYFNSNHASADYTLPNLQSLDMSSCNMSSEFAQFTSLMQLNLTDSAFAGQIPLQISHLSKLVSLDLSWNYYRTLDERTLGGLVQNLTEVRQLFLDGINMSSINPSVLMNISSSLSSLSLEDCGLQGKFPENIFHLPNLKLLNLRYHHDLNIYLPNFNQSNHLELLDLSLTNLSGALPNSIGNLVSLKYLLLSYTSLSGALPNSIGNLVSLKDLDLHQTSLSGALPNSIGNLVSLEHLDLSGTSLSGALPNSIGNLVSLEYLDLRYTSLSGALPNSIGNLVSLKILTLSFTNLSGALPNPISNLRSLKYLSLSGAPLCAGSLNSIGNLISLESLDLKACNFSRIIPRSLGNLSQLNHSNLSRNNFSGISQLVNLTSLDLSSNNLSGIEEFDLFSKLQNLDSLYLSSCNINQFPQFLRGSKVLRIYGKIPKWMWDVGKDSLFYLNLSRNFMTELEQLPWKNIEILDLSSNLIQGDLLIPPLTTSIFLISNNNLNGEMSDLICNVSYLEILDISHSHLSGIIPQCFGKLSKSLCMLNLGTNKLHGTIPATFAKGCQLENLNLNANQLEGPLTRSILNCRSLQVLDLGNNKINATFPHWLGTLQELKVLVMKSNQMHGSINGKRRTHYFRKLQILDPTTVLQDSCQLGT